MSSEPKSKDPEPEAAARPEDSPDAMGEDTKRGEMRLLAFVDQWVYDPAMATRRRPQAQTIGRRRGTTRLCMLTSTNDNERG